MPEPEVSGIQLAIFGNRSFDQVRAWLGRHLREHLGLELDAVRFQAGDNGAVFGVRVAGAKDLVVKALRLDEDAARLRSVVHCQRALAAAGFGCADVVDGPSRTDGVLAVVEQHLSCTPTGSPHDPAARRAMAAGLARQIELLRDLDGSPLVAGRPAWANWDRGAWPRPHDPIFDFSVPVSGFEWLDHTAGNAARALRAASSLPSVIGHSDWVWQNVCVRDGRLVAGYDWDSLIFAPESCIVGLAAGAFTQGSPVPPDAPSAIEVADFISDYQTASHRDFGPLEQKMAEAAAIWVRCYNARCQVDNRVRRAIAAPAGSFIDQLEAAPPTKIACR